MHLHAHMLACMHVCACVCLSLCVCMFVCMHASVSYVANKSSQELSLGRAELS